MISRTTWSVVDDDDDGGGGGGEPDMVIRYNVTEAAFLRVSDFEALLR